MTQELLVALVTLAISVGHVSASTLCDNPPNQSCEETCDNVRACDLFNATRWRADKRIFGIEDVAPRPAGFENAFALQILPAAQTWNHEAISFMPGPDIQVRYITDPTIWGAYTDVPAREGVPVYIPIDDKLIKVQDEILVNCLDMSRWSLNESCGAPGTWDMRAIVVHEVGHQLGMDDCWAIGFECTSEPSCTVMALAVSPGECYPTYHAPTPFDFAAIDCLYPHVPPTPPATVFGTWGAIKALYAAYFNFNYTVVLSAGSNTVVWNRVASSAKGDYWVYRSEGDSDDVKFLGSVAPNESVFVDEDIEFGKRYTYHIAGSDGTTLTEVGTPSAGLKLVKDHIFDDALETAWYEDADLVVFGTDLFASLEVSSDNFEIRKLDASNPQSIVEAGRHSGLEPIDALCLNDDGTKLYVQTHYGFMVLDATQSNLPTLGQVTNIVSGSGTTGDTMADMAVDGDVVFLACGVKGLKAIAVDRPTLPFIAGTFDPDGASNGKLVWDAQMNGGSLYVSERNQDGSANRSERLSVHRDFAFGHLANVTFQVECASDNPTCWTGFSAGSSMVGRIQDGPFELEQDLSSAHPFTIVNASSGTGLQAIRSVDAPAVGPAWVIRDSTGGPVDTLKFFSTFDSYDFDSRFLYATTPMWFDPYDRELVAFDVWGDGIGLLYAGGDQLGSCLSGTVRSQGKYVYVLDDFKAPGWSQHKVRLRIYEKASGCKPDPVHPVRILPESEAYKVGQNVTVCPAVGCPSSVHIELLQDGNVVSDVSTQSFAIADDVARSVNWPLNYSTDHFENHSYAFRVTASYPDYSSTVFLSNPFRIEIGAKREVAVGGGKPFTSIQAAVDASASGDTVVVYPGNYNEVLTLKSNVRVIGKPGASIVSGQSGPAVSVSDEVFPPVLDGLEFHAVAGVTTGAISVTCCGIKIKNCAFNSLTRAVSIASGHAEFTSCTFANNQDPAGFGGAVYLGGTASYSASAPPVTFTRCTFAGNTAPEAAAVRVGANRCPSFDHCVFAGNHPTAASGGSVVGGAGGVSATFQSCTFVSNNGSESFDVVRLEPGGTVPIPTIDATIFSGNSGGNALGAYGGTYGVAHSDFFDNSTGDATWASTGTDNFSENPAFCPSGDYSIYAFSPCAAGVKNACLVGAKEVACVPSATITVLPGGTNSPDDYLFVCPKGDGDTLAVQVALDPAVMTRAPDARELAIKAPYVPLGVFSDKAITSDIAASAPGYTMRIGHKYLSGYTWLHLPIYLNGYPLAQQALVKRRSPDIVDGAGGQAQDGTVTLPDLSRWLVGYPYSGHPAPYDSLSDLNADHVVNGSDFSMFCVHYGQRPEHGQPFSPPALQMTFPGQAATSAAHVGMEFTEEYVTTADRRLNVDVSLEGATGATACIFAVKTNRSDLRFRGWERANPNILFANVTVDSVQQLYVGAGYPTPYTKGSERLGRMAFDIDGTAPISIGENEFVLTVGDIQVFADNQTYGAQLSGVLERTIKGAVQKLYYNRLEQNFPNPFNPQTTIAFSISKPSNVHLAIYDITGARVRDLVDEKRVPGVYRVVWNGRSQNGNPVASGVYFYKLTAGSFTSSKKMVVLK